MKERIVHRDGTVEIVEYTPQEPTIEEKKTLAAQYLTDTDYKVIKCAEAMLAGAEMPYDVAELINKRQEARDIINL